MKAFLLYRDRDFYWQQPPPPNEPDLVQDLELHTLLDAMAGGDEFLWDTCRQVLVAGQKDDRDTILYRQAILRDCLNHPDVIRGVYELAVQTIETERREYWGLFSKYPAQILRRSIDVLAMFVGALKKLRSVADEHAVSFASEGLRTLCATLQAEMSDEYFAQVEEHLKELQFRRGVLISARLGQGNKGADYTLRQTPRPTGGLVQRLLGPRPESYGFRIADRDEQGAKALGELEERGINLVANAMAQSNDHILSFFRLLRGELAFYVGGLNLHQKLTQLGEPVCFPEPAPLGEPRHAFRELYDPCLALTTQARVVGNDADGDGKHLVVITGANQGGKTTFLRSIGVAQVMMQSGLFVAAEAFAANVVQGIFTHFKREEDASMTSGKLDEELSRMSTIADLVTPNSLILFNESFAATNEREGSEIARQVVSALLEWGIKVFFVTHQYEFARGWYEGAREDSLFLRAERREDGERTFRLVEGKPLETSFGEDLYDAVFGQDSAGR